MPFQSDCIQLDVLTSDPVSPVEGTIWFNSTDDRLKVCRSSETHIINDIKVEFEQTVNPTVDDDISLGYTVGSKWINTSTDQFFICLDNTDGAAVWANLTTHASKHQSGGTDPLKLDDLAAPENNTDLDATTLAHGLLPKLGGGTTNFLRADGTWSPPTGGSGEANTGSNVGTGGVGVFKQKAGVDLEFKKVNAGSAKITVTDDTGNDEVDIDVVTGTDANSVCIGNDSRLSDPRIPTGVASGDLGGTYPSPTVDDGADGTAIHDNLAGEISLVTEKASPVSADLLLIEDSADSNNKKRVQVGNLPGGGGGGLETKAGTVASSSFTGNYYTVTFSTAFSDANYSISLSVSSASATPAPFWRTKTSSTFRIYIHPTIPAGVTFDVDWVCTKHGES